jgi:hypothetical protein
VLFRSDRMSWVTWRQHRLEGAWALVFGALLAASIAFVASQLQPASCPGLINGYCFRDDAGGLLAQQSAHFNLYQYGLVVLPALAGAFIGCPLVAREIENGTHRLAWTQGVTRLRWLLIKLVLVFVPLLLIAALVGILELILVNQQGTGANHWAFFDQHAPITVAATVFALSLGVVAGAVVGKAVPAMAVTLVAFVVVRVGLAQIARPNFIAPLVYSTQDPAGYNPAAYPTAWWVDQPSVYDSAGHLLSNGRVLGGGQQVAKVVQHFQPGDRFWTFQAIESAILVGLAAVLLGFAIYWVTRRVS